MRHAFFLSIALTCAFTGCGKQSAPTTSPPKPTPMNWTLDISGDKKIQHPTEADIREAVSALNITNKKDAFLVLGPSDWTYIQTWRDQKGGFDLEYQENDTNHHYRATRDFTAEEIIKALTSYSTGSDDWKRMAEWEHMNL